MDEAKLFFNNSLRVKGNTLITELMLLVTFFVSSMNWGYIFFYAVCFFMLVRIRLVINIHAIKKYFGFYIIPNVIIWIHAILCAVLHREYFFVFRSINNFIYIMMCIIFAYCIYKLHNKKSITIILQCIILYYLLQMCIAFISVGPELFFSNIYRLGTPILTRWLEAHDIGLSLGLAILYLLYFFDGKKSQKIGYLFAVTVIFLLCWKRIAVGSIVVVIIFKFIYNRKIDKKGNLTLIWGIGGIVICFAYVYLVNNELILGWLWKHGINNMGRAGIYRYFKQFYTFSPLYFGRGSGFTGKTMSLIAGTQYNVGGILAIHSDILRVYIEYGFWGALLWYSYYLIILPRKASASNEKYSEVLFLIAIYAFIVYLTDNTSNYMLFQTFYMLIPLCCGLNSPFSSKQNIVN